LRLNIRECCRCCASSQQASLSERSVSRKPGTLRFLLPANRAEREAAMSTFRVNKNVNYTVMSNYHLQDKKLSLKAKGLLSYMLSLSDDWDYSLKGLTIGCKDGLDSVRTAVLELEEHGYVRRQKVRNARGQIIDYDYQVYESPVEDVPAVPGDDTSTPPPSTSSSQKSGVKPCSSPFLDFPNLAEPNLEKATQQNTNKQNTKRQSTNLSGQTAETEDFDQMATRVRAEFREKLEIDTLAKRYAPEMLQELLDNISASYDRTSGLVARAAAFTEDTGLPLTLGNFLDYYHLDPRAIYSKKICFSRLCVRAGAASDFAEPLEETMTKAFARFAVVDSRRWIRFLLDLLPRLDNTDFSKLSPIEQRMLQMFYVTVWGKAAEDWNREDVLDDLYALSDSPVLLGELQALLQYQYGRIDFIDEPVDVGFDCPLDLHCTYTRDQLLVALDFLKLSTVREGVKWLPEKQLDVFFVTLNKADKDYSPTTMYNDYSINEKLFHWQSQSTTAESSATGQRYIHHREKGSRVLLFVREFKADSRFGGAAAYTYLGTVNYVKHEGSRPMNITWKLDRPIPARFLKKTNKLIVG
jgi:hypothetical protein